jgi:GAF domain-containing protein
MDDCGGGMRLCRQNGHNAAHLLTDPGFLFEPNRAVAMRAVVDAALTLAHADMANVQLLDATAGGLRIAAYNGFDQDFLDFFAVVDGPGSACGAAFARAAAVTVEDVAHSPVFDGTPAQYVVLRAGVRAVHSTPIRDISGRPIGMLSVHYRHPHRLPGKGRHILATLARRAGLWIEADGWIKAGHPQL